MKISLVLACAYLLGSIPFGYLIVRFTQKADVRETGSGGTGATNVTRRAGRAAGVITLMLDALKGAAAVWLADWLLGSASPGGGWIAAAGVAAILGHCFPVWLGFRGGKGVATAIGVFAVLALVPLQLALGVFFLLAITTRYISLSSIAALLSLPIFLWLLRSYRDSGIEFVPLWASSVAIAAIVVFMHRANIGRLMAGTESRFK
ncbi:MAG: glycerol-3-phosphate 1-O-acyltransferase PlsY [Pyrinomonadaceae bacterium]